MLQPDVYLRATAAQVQAYYRRELASRIAQKGPQSQNATRGSVPRRQTLSLQDVLPAGYWTRYREKVADLPTLGDTLRAPCYIIDANVTASYGGKPKSASVPTLLRSSRLVIVTRSGDDRLLLPEELLALHGLVLPAHVLARMPSAEVRSVVGNSMHVAQVGCFLQFALATRSVGEVESAGDDGSSAEI